MTGVGNGRGPVEVVTGVGFRVALTAVFLLTALEAASKGVRYALCGVAVVLFVVEILWSRRRRTIAAARRGRSSERDT